MQSRFAIKNNYNREFFTFYDLYSDFTATLDGEGIALVKGVFAKNAREYSPKEREIAQLLIAKGVVEDFGAYAVPEERDQTPLGNVDIEITKRCNLRCKHCFTEKADSDLDSELLMRLVPELEALGVVEVSLNGGEPFLHPELGRIVSALSGKFKLVMFSNGLHLDVGLIKKYRVAKINISLDGFAESHEYLRGKGTYEKTVAVIQKLVAEKIPVSINTVIFPRNVETIEDFIQYCKDRLGVCGVKLCAIYPIGNAVFFPDLQEASKPVSQSYQKYFERKAGSLQGPCLPCGAGVTQLFINSRGEIYPCHLFEDPKFRMGELTAHGLSQNYLSFLNSHSYFTEFNLKNFPGCSNCPVLSRCKTGCRARAHLLEKDVYAPDPFACKHLT